MLDLSRAGGWDAFGQSKACLLNHAMAWLKRLAVKTFPTCFCGLLCFMGYFDVQAQQTVQLHGKAEHEINLKHIWFDNHLPERSTCLGRAGLLNDGKV